MPRLIVAVLFTVLCACGHLAAAVPGNVPAVHAQTYATLDRILDTQLAQIKPVKTDPPFKPVYCLELLPANCNRGPALFHPDTLPFVELTLDRYKAMGVQCVKFAMHFPLLRPDFPDAAKYLAFYKEVVQKAHAREIKVLPHVTVIFADTPFSPFQGIYKGLDLARFKKEYAEMVHLVVRELQPDYLALLTEPDTHAKLTGISELNRPETIVDVIRTALQGLDRGRTLIGAGSGSWSSPAFAKALAEKTDVDFIAIHIYPITGNVMSNVREMARVAHAHKKQVVIDEAWLYKIQKPGGGESVAASSEVFRRDIFSFWEPLDEKFVRMVLGIAAEERVSVVSFFWSNLMFAYAEYSADLEQMPYREATQKQNRSVTECIRAGKLSPLGEFYRNTISEGAAK